MSAYDEHYFIACGKAVEVKAFDGSILTHGGETLWLSEDSGYSTLTTTKGYATHFKKPPTVVEAAKYDGMPWSCRLQPGSLQVFEVSEHHEHTRTEKQATP